MTDKKWMPARWFVIDVESIGLHGEGFQVAWVFIDASTDTVIDEGMFHCPAETAQGFDDDRAWVAKNIPPPRSTSFECRHPRELRERFWNMWADVRDEGNTVMAADCPWPVEARFLAACVDDDPVSRKWEGPYPLIDVASVLAAHGMDPLADHERLESEPQHCPLGDARQSARILLEAVRGHSVTI